MSFASVPDESKSQINRAGVILNSGKDTPGYTDALNLAERWRACHAYPINTFQATLRKKIRSFEGEPIVAQRLKRMPTIIDKLSRFPTMQLSRMQDIGGVRAVVSTIEDVYTLAENYKSNKKLLHELLYEKDYINFPRDEDGYRSLHLVYSYRNKNVPSYDGLRLEFQIRSKLQHTWATAVETMGTFLGLALKSRQGDKAWLEFFSLVSSAFALKENASPVPKYAKLNRAAIFSAIAETENQLDALTKMSAFSAAADLIVTDNSRNKWSYHLIILNSIKRQVNVIPFERGGIEQAIAAYSEAEYKALNGESIEPVLVSAGPLAKLKKAYPNFFLDIKDFQRSVKAIVEADKRSKKR